MPPKIAQGDVLARALPHDFTIQYPIRREYFKEHFHGDADVRQRARRRHLRATEQAPEEVPVATPLPRRPSPLSAQLEERSPFEPLLVYAHLPFCESKCRYCNFAISTSRDWRVHEAYVEALVAQITLLDETLPLETPIGGIDIGGGTPTLLPSSLLLPVVRALRRLGDRREGSARPLSIETTPSIATRHPRRMAALAAAGVDRISVGLQSTDEATLSSVNRGSQDTYRDAITALAHAGFARVSADLIFGLPGQTPAAFAQDLRRVASLPLDALTIYDCLYRGKGRAIRRNLNQLPSWNAVYGPMYDAAHRFLTRSARFHAPYGSINFSRHPAETGTSPYFEGRLLHWQDFVGLGNYATSMIGDQWSFAPYSPEAWHHDLSIHPSEFPVQDAYILPAAERMAKSVLFALSFGHVSAARFCDVFGVPLHNVYADEIKVAVAQRWLSVHPRTGDLSIRPPSFRVMPRIRALFYPQQALDWFQSFDPQAVSLVSSSSPHPQPL